MLVTAPLLAGCGGATALHNHATGYGTTLYGSLPRAGTPRAGGVITLAQLTGDTPTSILPIDNCTDTTGGNQQLDELLWVPLYNGPLGARPVADLPDSAAAGLPVASDGGRTYTINLRHGLRWSDGTPVQAQDVLFSIDLMRAAVRESPTNWCQYFHGQFPTDITGMSAPNPDTVVLHLNAPYNPGYFAYDQLADTNFGVYPLPSRAWNIDRPGGPHLDFRRPANARRIYDFLEAQSAHLGGFATNPLWREVDGPFRLASFDVTNGSYTLTANPAYAGPRRPRFRALAVETFTGQGAILNALEAGELDVGPFDQADIGALPRLRSAGYAVFGGARWGYFGVTLNFEDRTDHFAAVIRQLYVRQALQRLIDEPALIKGVFHGAAAPQYGPVPRAPSSPYTPRDSVRPIYPYDPRAAVALLRAHGWNVVPGGTTTCGRPGVGATDCGAGIPRGTPIRAVLVSEPAAEAPATDLEAEALVSAARHYAGIDLQLRTLPASALQNYGDSFPQGQALRDAWGLDALGGAQFNYYPTQVGGLNTGGPFNSGAYADPTADRLIRCGAPTPER
jgi:peptide/nickel transport system substrate-binding protein